ncbi:MAG: tRNA dihydrouridine synthase DusB [Patescibacteria group bacterium]|nr:MAG: tRNA dihydrouridine synthase DusB [Patescibacteria group bacterium]
MDGVTDHPYRHIQKKYGTPQVIYTEFTNVEGVCHGAIRLLKDFLFDETQRPIVAQIYGTTPKYFRQVAVVLCELGFDGIDINMGCPAKSVDSSGAGAALIKTPKLAQEIIAETKAGIQDYLHGLRSKDCPDISQEIATEVAKRHEKLPQEYKENREIPVSIKTRIGYDTPVVEEWIPTLLAMNPAVIALHGRTLKQQYSGESNWNEIHKATQLCKNTETLLLGNGDVLNYEQAIEYVKKYEVDGILIGRGSFGNPFAFQPHSDKLLQQHNIFEIAIEHCKLYETTYESATYHFMPMRKHLGWYVKGIEGAREVRIELFQANNSMEVESVFKKHNLI